MTDKNKGGRVSTYKPETVTAIAELKAACAWLIVSVAALVVASCWGVLLGNALSTWILQ